MKIEIFYYGLALIWGLALGLFYFGGLWWTLCSTGPSSRAIFLNEVPFLGRIPIDAHLNASVDTREASLEKYTDSQAMECYNLITKKIMECI